MPAMSVEAMQDAVLAWYSQTKRDLPWRRTHDPYAILVSEVMLHQTQVTRVVPRYEAWLRRWPTIAALAAAPAADAIAEWSGLGYNRRSRPRAGVPWTDGRPAARSRLCLEPGPLRPRPGGVPGPAPALRRLPDRCGLPLAGADVPAASAPVALRGLLPAAAGAAPSGGGDGGPDPGGGRRRRGARLARARRAGRGGRGMDRAAGSDQRGHECGQTRERGQLGVGGVALGQRQTGPVDPHGLHAARLRAGHVGLEVVAGVHPPRRVAAAQLGGVQERRGGRLRLAHPLGVDDEREAAGDRQPVHRAVAVRDRAEDVAGPGERLHLRLDVGMQLDRRHPLGHPDVDHPQRQAGVVHTAVVEGAPERLHPELLVGALELGVEPGPARVQDVNGQLYSDRRNALLEELDRAPERPVHRPGWAPSAAASDSRIAARCGARRGASIITTAYKKTSPQTAESNRAND